LLSRTRQSWGASSYVIKGCWHLRFVIAAIFKFVVEERSEDNRNFRVGNDSGRANDCGKRRDGSGGREK
jgi:hypothetical protein